MQKKNQAKPRPLPGLVLLPMPGGLKKWRCGPPQPRGAQAWTEADIQEGDLGNGAFRTALRNGLDDLFALAALLLGFTASGALRRERSWRGWST